MTRIDPDPDADLDSSRAPARGAMPSAETPASECVTEGVRVRVAPRFLPEASSPSECRFVWAYAVEIQNLSDAPLRLTGRHWRVVDSAGHVRDVSGAGVSGRRRWLQPGETFRYTSGAPLRQASGMMQGRFTADRRGERLEVRIPPFSLDSPFETRLPS